MRIKVDFDQGYQRGYRQANKIKYTGLDRFYEVRFTRGRQIFVVIVFPTRQNDTPWVYPPIAANG